MVDTADISQKVSVPVFSAAVHYGSIFAHSEEVQNTAGANPRGIELAYLVQRRDKNVVDLCNCYPRQGFVFSWFDFDSDVLGKGGMLGWTLEPTYRLGKKLELGIRGIAGLAWLSNPFDSIKNPTNQSYSTTISGWIVVGASFGYAINDKWKLRVGGNFEHLSNGGMKQPNKGVNYPTASLHLEYTPNPEPYYRGKRSGDKYWRGQPWRKDIGIMGTGKRWVNANGSSTRQPILGGLFQMAKQVGHINAITMAAEGYYDGYNAERIKTDSVGDISAVRLALMGGHEFLLGRFIFSQQIGVYVYKPAPYDQSWFHRWGVLYNMGRHFKAGINLKAHLQVADFIDARLVYSWK